MISSAGIQMVLDAHFAGRPGERGGDALKHPAVAAARDDEMHALFVRRPAAP